MNAIELLKRGGAWLAAARNYLQWHVKNGDSVIWGSGEPITMTVKQFEEAASEITEAALKEFIIKGARCGECNERLPWKMNDGIVTVIPCRDCK